MIFKGTALIKFHYSVSGSEFEDYEPTDPHNPSPDLVMAIDTENMEDDIYAIAEHLSNLSPTNKSISLVIECINPDPEAKL